MLVVVILCRVLEEANAGQDERGSGGEQGREAGGASQDTGTSGMDCGKLGSDGGSLLAAGEGPRHRLVALGDVRVLDLRHVTPLSEPSPKEKASAVTQGSLERAL